MGQFPRQELHELRAHEAVRAFGEALWPGDALALGDRLSYLPCLPLLCSSAIRRPPHHHLSLRVLLSRCVVASGRLCLARKLALRAVCGFLILGILLLLTRRRNERAQPEHSKAWAVERCRPTEAPVTCPKRGEMRDMPKETAEQGGGFIRLSCSSKRPFGPSENPK